MTRLMALRIAIGEMEKKRRAASRDGRGLFPAEDMEDEFRRADETVLALKEICQAMQCEGVKKSIAAWQKDLMEDPESIRLSMSDLESR